MAGVGGTVRLCQGSVLVDGGRGLRFTVLWQGRETPAFAIRYRGVVRAYLNRCGHLAVELDWEPGEFFNAGGDALICATHGACYDPGTGACVSGRCHGVALVPLVVGESGGAVHLTEQNDVHLIKVFSPGNIDDGTHTTGR